METPSVKVLFFGDHASDKVALIRSLVRTSKQSPAVRRFVEEATDTLQQEFARMSRLEHGWNKTFDSLLELVEANASADEDEGGQNGILTCMLTSIGRIGELVAQSEQDMSILGTTSPDSKPIEVVGLCMGELPAVVALAAHDTMQIFTLGREMLRVVFRLASHIWRRMGLIDTSSGSWAQTFIGLPAADVQNILDRFHTECKIPVTRRIAVGVVSKGFVTLFGPPSTQARLQTWPGAKVLQDAPRIDTDADGCVHTPYLPELDIDAILSECSSEFLQWPLDLKHKARMASPVDGKFYECQTLGELLPHIIKDIAHRVLNLDVTLDGCASRLKADGLQANVEVIAMGPNAHIPAMTGALKAASISHKVVLGTSLPTSFTTSELPSSRGFSGQVAIVGMSGRFPENDTVQGFWQDLLDGKTHIKEVPKDRFDIKDWYDATLETKNSTVATKGAWLANPGLFDQKIFNISPREAAQIDPIHRQFLTCTYEALQHAGYNPGASLSMEGPNVSTFFGQLGEDWHDIVHQKGADIYYVPGIARTFAPSRVNYHYKFGGGSYAVDSACASSITTIVLACQALQSRACDMALAGGGNMIYTPIPYSGLSRSGMISPTDGCRTFHDDADGYARGEGVGVVVLKRLEDAVSDNDNILGVIRGSARTFSTTTTSITHPSHESQERVYRRVLAQSSIDPSEIAYVEMHGTGTQAGDWEEMSSVLNVIAPAGSRTKDNPLTVGTVKAAIGHGEAAAGVTALIKVLLMLRDKVIPAQPGWPFKINHRFPPLDPRHVHLATQIKTLKPSPKGDKKIKMMINSFDASGGESCLLIEEAPGRSDNGEGRTTDPRTAFAVTLSGRTTQSLGHNRQRLLDWLDMHPDANIADISYTSTARRMHETLRAAYVATSTAELAEQLSNAIIKGADPKVKPKPSSRVFLFTGQGSHYAGMGSQLFNTSRPFREKLLAFQEMATHMGLPEFLPLISNPDLEDATSTTQTQLAIVSLEICMAEMLAMYGVTPTAVLGHSLGEYAALCVAGVLSVADTLYLVGHRALLMEKHLVPNTFAMLATSASPERLEEVYRSLGLASCNIACKNAPTITVVSGTVEDIEKLQSHMVTEGVRCTILRIPYGFHSAQVEPILGEYTELASGVDFKAPNVSVVSSFLGRVVDAGDQSVFGPQYLSKQCRGTVDFVGALQAIAAAEKTSIGQVRWVEMGPEPTLIGLTRKTLSDLPLSNFLPGFKPNPVEDNWKLLSTILKAAYESGVNVNWPEFQKPFQSHAKLLELPLYAFHYQNFWHEPFKNPEAILPAKEVSTSEHICTCQSVQNAPVPAVVRPTCPGFPSASLQSVISEDTDDAATQLVASFTADTADPALRPAIDGHVVFGHIICPMSVLVDMALTAGKYCHYRLHNTSKTPVMSVTDINMSHALALMPDEPRRPMVRVTATMQKHSMSANIHFTWLKFKAGNTSSPVEETGGTCTVNFENEEKWPSNINNSLFLVQSRIASLRSAATTGQAHRLLKPVIYRMFAETVDYSTPFRGIEEAILDLDCKDAVAKVTLPADVPTGRFVMNPYWTDALTHLGGFLLNSGLRYDQEDLLCMARGFDSWRVVSGGVDMVPGQTYTCYTFMQDVEHGFVVGDCYILDEKNNLVQTLLGLKFQKLRRAVIDTLFGSTTAHVAAPKPKIPERPQLVHGSIAAPVARSMPVASFAGIQSQGASATATITPQATISPPSTPPLEDYKKAASDANNQLDSILSIVAREAGCLKEDLVEEAHFADLGIDSLMGISILAVIKRETGLDLDATFFIDHATLGEARSSLEDILGLEASSTVTGLVTPPDEPLLHAPKTMLPSELPTPPSNDSDVDPILSSSTKWSPPAAVPRAPPTPPVSYPETTSLYSPPAAVEASLPKQPSARIVHLSGPKAAPTNQLFLLADESGSSLACIQLPAVSCLEGKPISIWGIESPFTKNPDLLCGRSVPELAKISLEAIQAHQTNRPGRFFIGGLSAGAAVAIEAARQLTTDNNKQFGGLILLDPSVTSTKVEAAVNAPSTRLKPAHKTHVANMIEILKGYTDNTSALPQLRAKTTAIVPEIFNTNDDGKILQKIIPEIQLVTVEAAQRGMNFPAATNTGHAYRQAIQMLAV